MIATHSNEADVIDLVNRLGLDLFDDRIVRMVRSGFQSGFPPCCISFFVLLWWHPAILLDGRSDDMVTSDYRRLLDQTRTHGKLKEGFVLCPACLLAVLAPCESRTTGAASSRKLGIEATE
jgi:hypothetical protein